MDSGPDPAFVADAMEPASRLHPDGLQPGVKFSPGPWDAQPNACKTWFVYGGLEAETANGTKYRELICGGNSHATLTEANARLIAVAPEMFEALEEARIELARLCWPGSKRALAIVEAALAKARGGA